MCSRPRLSREGGKGLLGCDACRTRRSCASSHHNAFRGLWRVEWQSKFARRSRASELG